MARGWRATANTTPRLRVNLLKQHLRLALLDGLLSGYHWVMLVCWHWFLTCLRFGSKNQRARGYSYPLPRGARSLHSPLAWGRWKLYIIINNSSGREEQRRVGERKGDLEDSRGGRRQRRGFASASFSTFHLGASRFFESQMFWTNRNPCFSVLDRHGILMVNVERELTFR